MKLKALTSVSLIAAAFALAAPASAQDVSWTASIDFNSEYVFRGFGLGAESIQPGIEASIGGFTFGAWASTGIGEESIINADEIDLYGGYAFDLSPTTSLDIGATLYHYPQAGDVFDIGRNDASTFELYAGLGFAVPLDPSVYVYYDTSLETLTAEGAVSYSFPTGPSTSIDLSGALGAVEPDQGDGYQYGTIGAALSYAVTDNASLYASLNGSVASEDNFLDYEDFLANPLTAQFDSNTVWYGFGVSSSF
ncbi:TorF family putative porin [Robiginitomaculum antarcticum]|uniref:TorF family putative porin n=1 Tax=Robiginitomaculum antarcticum TaxID=437507 RepID=UPI00036D68E8|nr:TorF family putative porin [Robiginitomaculum antarcticum]